MAIWLFRAGKSGEYENKFLNEGRIYLTWDSLNINLKDYADKSELLEFLLELYSNNNRNTIRNWLGQIYPIAHRIQINDWVILPSKLKSAIHIGRVTGDYEHHSDGENPFYHSRGVDWFATNIPRSNFDQDILYSLGAFMTVCQIKRNDAEKRIKAMSTNNWTVSRTDLFIDSSNTDEDDASLDSTTVDLEEYAVDQIAKLIIRKYKGHRMEFLVESILRAEGFITYRSPEGADKGMDILAAPEAMGFGQPRICVQVKTTDVPIGRPILDQLIGTMHNFGAEQGLLVSWGGFKSSVEQERATQFFKVRLWGQKELIDAFLKNYSKLDESIQAEIPLKRIWSLSVPDEE